jgi:hypothetical protein
MKISDHLKAIKSSIDFLIDNATVIDDIKSAREIEEQALSIGRENRGREEAAHDQKKRDWEDEIKRLRRDTELTRNDRAIELKRSEEARKLALEELSKATADLKEAQSKRANIARSIENLRSKYHGE